MYFRKLTEVEKDAQVEVEVEAKGWMRDRMEKEGPVNWIEGIGQDPKSLS